MMFQAIRFFIALVILLALAACAPISPTPAPAPTVPPPTSAPNPEFDSARAYAHNRFLAETIGARVAGTDAATRAGDYIAQEFTTYGYVIEKQVFMFEGWEDRGTQVQLVAPETRTLDARPIQYSPAGKVEAEVVVVSGLGEPVDFARVNVKGKIALLQRGTIPFSDKALNAQNAGALAAIIYNNAPDNFQGTLRDRTTIPALALSGRDGQAMIALLAKGAVKIKIESDAGITQRTGRNIIATKRGASDRVIVLGAHYDSVELGKGANDNGSGTAVLLELARVLGQKSHNATLVFIAFDAEELGLIGSRHYVAGLNDDARKKIVAMLNFDMLAGGSGGLGLGGDGDVGRAARDAAEALKIPARNFRLGSGASSDHAPFQNAGIDTVFFSRDYDLLHTPQDTFDQIREQFLAEAGRVAVKVVEGLER